jgi:hypothetical protein
MRQLMEYKLKKAIEALNGETKNLIVEKVALEYRVSSTTLRRRIHRGKIRRQGHSN